MKTYVITIVWENGEISTDTIQAKDKETAYADCVGAMADYVKKYSVIEL